MLTMKGSIELAPIASSESKQHLLIPRTGKGLHCDVITQLRSRPIGKVPTYLMCAANTETDLDLLQTDQAFSFGFANVKFALGAVSPKTRGPTQG